MMRRLVVFMGLAVMVGYAFQEPPGSNGEDPLNQAEKKIMDLNGESLLPPDRDPKYTPATERIIQEFLRQYPDSDYAPMARQILKDVQENLALGNFRIAQFYVSKANCARATSRLKIIIEKYPNFSRIDEVNQLYKTLSITKQPSQLPQGSAK